MNPHGSDLPARTLERLYKSRRLAERWLPRQGSVCFRRRRLRSPWDRCPPGRMARASSGQIFQEPQMTRWSVSSYLRAIFFTL